MLAYIGSFLIRSAAASFFFLLYSLSLLSQAEYAVSNIPEELLKNADVVIRSFETIEDIISQRKKILKMSITKTIISSSDSYDTYYLGYSPHQKIEKLEIHIFDANGNLLEKASKNRFEDFSAHDGTWLSDDRIKAYKVSYSSLPITVKFEYELESSFTSFLTPWIPVPGYGVSVQKASHQVNCEPHLGLEFNESNLDNDLMERSNSINSCSYKLANFVAIGWEPYAPSASSIFPRVNFRLRKFHCAGVDGEASNWKELGHWIDSKLLEGQDNLTPEVIAEIQDLTAGLSKEEKARKVYAYVQARSRYISIQLGIGGWRPFSANEVHEEGFGDCKALSNYTQALLTAAGVDANYAVLFAGREQRNLSKDFSSLSGDHVVLCLPNLNAADTVWLECTSQSTPFGYLGEYTDNRNALIVSNDGGQIVRTTRYVDEDNLTRRTIDIDLKEDGSGEASTKSSYEGIEYSRFQIQFLNEEDQRNQINEELGNYTRLNVEDIHFKDDRKNTIFHESFTFHASNFGHKAGSDLLVAVVPLDQHTFNFKKSRNRKFDICVPRGKEELMEVNLNLPKGYMPILPEDISIETKFGLYKLELSETETGCKIQRQLKILKNIYPKEDIEDYRLFLKAVKKSDGAGILIQKTE